MVVEVGETLFEPPVGSLPDHPPLAVQPVAFVLDQVSVEELPAVIEVGLAIKLMDGLAVLAAAGDKVSPKAKMASE